MGNTPKTRPRHQREWFAFADWSCHQRGPSLKSLESGTRHQVVLTRHKRFGTTPAGRWDKLRNPARSERPRGLSLCQAWQPKGISEEREVSEGSLKKNQRIDKVLRPASEKFLVWLDIWFRVEVQSRHQMEKRGGRSANIKGWTLWSRSKDATKQSKPRVTHQLLSLNDAVYRGAPAGGKSTTIIIPRREFEYLSSQEESPGIFRRDQKNTFAQDLSSSANDPIVKTICLLSLCMIRCQQSACS